MLPFKYGKLKPQYDLEVIKSLVSQGLYQIKRIASGNARNDFGIFSDEILEIILLIE